MKAGASYQPLPQRKTVQYTQVDTDNLADIIWWIKGYLAASNNGDSSCPFGEMHIESLRLARLLMLEHQEK